LLVGQNVTGGRAQAAISARQKKDLSTMRAIAAAHNFSVVSNEKLLLELGQAIGKRMMKRRGNEVYQMLAFHLPYFPRTLLESILPKETVVEESGTKIAWVLGCLKDLRGAYGPF